MTDLYDPLTWENLMAGLVVYFEKQPSAPLEGSDRVEGPGVYALFYTGSLSVYASISRTAVPIYVGRADPPGARKGPTEADASAPALRDRLREHMRSLRSAQNLELSDFECRYLAIVPVWIPLAERFLIDHYRPVWNLALDGFGNHHQGAGRTGGAASWWDTMHPGRKWADRMRREKTEAQARTLLDQFFKERANG